MGKLREVSGSTALVLAGLTFVLGFYLGYKTKSLRLRYLRNKQNRLMNKLNKTTEDIQYALNSM